MKAKTLIGAILLIALTSSAETLPQKNYRIAYDASAVKPQPNVFTFFNVHRQGRGVTAAWHSTATTNQVSGFCVMRTYEDPNDEYAEWTQVGSATCTNARNYRSTENNVSPGFISYRVVATLTGGGVVMSEVQTIRIAQH